MDNQSLAKQEQPENDKKILIGLTERLKKLLTCADERAAISEIARDGNLLAEARVALPALRNRALLPACAPGVREVVGKRFGLYPQPERNEAEWAAWWDDYTEALSDLPKSQIEAAMKAWIAKPESEFLPKPGQLRDLARQASNPAAVAYHRAREASAIVTVAAEPYRGATAPQGFIRPMPTGRDVEAVRAKAAAFMAAHESARKPAVTFKGAHGATIPGRAITAEMLASIRQTHERDGRWSDDVIQSIEREATA